MKVSNKGIIRRGVKYRGNKRVVYSSITIWCGSFPQVLPSWLDIKIPMMNSSIPVVIKIILNGMRKYQMTILIIQANVAGAIGR